MEEPINKESQLAQSSSLAMVHTRTVVGVQALPVITEVHLANGLPAFSTVGLPEAAVKESKDRVRGAILNSGFEFPAKRITVNLSPADIPKSGSRFDLPIALGILAASGQISNSKLRDFEFIGELALDGQLRKIKGVLPTVIAAAKAGRRLIVPQANSVEAGLLDTQQAYGARHLLDVSRFLVGQCDLEVCESNEQCTLTEHYPDLEEVKGQHQAKRALEIAASGSHSMLLIGPPGAGKSMLASRLPGIMPKLTRQESLESASVHSVAHGEFDPRNWSQRPFRQPHHSASPAALVGGGAVPQPGEISLAHRGILFLDELTEFSRSALEQLREPLETGEIHIARANQRVSFPAQFLLVAACNPCKCGFLGDGTDRCQCSAGSIENYRGKLSGPFLDRIDLHVQLSRVHLRELQRSSELEESSREVSKRVSRVQLVQMTRQGKLNSALGGKELEAICQLEPPLLSFLELVCEKLNMSARAYHRVLKIARTIADMEDEAQIKKHHLSEAIAYRGLDRR